MLLSAESIRRAEWIFAGVVIVWLSDAHGGIELLRDREIARTLGVVSLLLLALHRGELRALAGAAWAPLLLVLVVAASPFWSIDPHDSARAALAVASATAFGLWLALRFDVREQLRLVSIALALASLGGLVAVVVVPERAVMQDAHPGAWTGLHAHKNSLGSYLALAVLACGLHALANPRARLWAGGVALVALAMLVPARSVTSDAALVFAAAGAGGAAWLRERPPLTRRRVLIALPLLAALGAGIAFAVAPVLLPLVGRDVTLTRRTEIWTLAAHEILEHPWLGHGAGAFWHTAPASREIIDQLRFDPGSAHNAFVDLALELGGIGVAVFALAYGVAAARALGLALRERDAASLWPLAFVLWLLVINVAESRVLRGCRFAWVFLVASSVTAAARSSTRR